MHGVCCGYKSLFVSQVTLHDAGGVDALLEGVAEDFELVDEGLVILAGVGVSLGLVDNVSHHCQITLIFRFMTL